MKFQIGQKFSFRGIEGEVAFIDRYGKAYLIPDEDMGDVDGVGFVMKGLVFVVINKKGTNDKGERAYAILPGTKELI